MKCDLNCNGLQEIRNNHDIDSFTTLILGATLGKLVDHGMTDGEILWTADFLIQRIHAAQESETIQTAMTVFTDSLKINETEGNG